MKYAGIYPKSYESPWALERWLDQCFRFNTRRQHTVLGRRTPDAMYFGEPDVPQAA